MEVTFWASEPWPEVAWQLLVLLLVPNSFVKSLAQTAEDGGERDPTAPSWSSPTHRRTRPLSEGMLDFAATRGSYMVQKNHPSEPR